MTDDTRMPAIRWGLCQYAVYTATHYVVVSDQGATDRGVPMRMFEGTRRTPRGARRLGEKALTERLRGQVTAEVSGHATQL